jgi:hypothetical protein
VKHVVRSAVLAGLLLATPAAAFADPLDMPAIKVMLDGLGYPPKALGENGQTTKFEITLQSGNITVPIGLEVSPSTRYIWCTAFLGPGSKIDPPTALEMLKQQSAIQPSNFWITTSGNLMIGIAVDNREVTPAELRRVLEKLAADTASTTSLWDKPVP